MKKSIFIYSLKNITIFLGPGIYFKNIDIKKLNSAFRNLISLILRNYSFSYQKLLPLTPGFSSMFLKEV